MGARVAVISVLVATSVVALGATAVAPAGSATGWTAIPAEHVSGRDQVLTAVVAPAVGDVWGIGSMIDYPGGVMHFHTLAEHFNGESFDIVPTPDPAVADNSLYGAAASAPDDVWAVGTTSAGIGHNQTLIEHWDGSAWSIVDSPDPVGANVLDTVTVVARDDAWAGGMTIDSTFHLAAVALHWDGAQWTQVDVPGPPICHGQGKITAMSAVSAKSVWASGWCGRSGGDDHGYVLHWGGTAWTVVAGGHVPPNAQLLAIHARNDHDVWAVGQYVHGSPSQQSALTLHWDGKRWSAPLAAPGAVRLAGVASGAGGVWSVGDQDGVPFVPPWSGHFGDGAWHVKGVNVTEGALPAITTDPAGHLFAVGSQYLGGGGAGSTVALVLTR